MKKLLTVICMCLLLTGCSSAYDGTDTAIEELENIFGYRSPASVLKVFTPQETLAKVKEYEERNEIKVGDVVKFRGDCIESIVTKVDGYIVYRLFKDGGCNLFHYNKGDLVKTGHFDSIDEFMRSAD